jgi:hypothetical protein
MMYDDPTRHAAMLDEADALKEQAKKEYYKEINNVTDVTMVEFCFIQIYGLLKSLEYYVSNKYLSMSVESIANDLEGMALHKKIIEKGAELAVEAVTNGEE